MIVLILSLLWMDKAILHQLVTIGVYETVYKNGMMMG